MISLNYLTMSYTMAANLQVCFMPVGFNDKYGELNGNFKNIYCRCR
jgi:hypothetical protein